MPFRPVSTESCHGETAGTPLCDEEADMERYAAEHGLTDENLLNFKEYGTDFLVGVISQQIYKKMSSLPEEHMRKMAELYGQLNRDYCAGRPST